MKTSVIAMLAAGVFASSAALADCPNGHVPATGGAPDYNPSLSFGFGAGSIGGGVPQGWGELTGGTKTDVNCVTAGSLSIGGAPAVTGEWVVDDNGTPDNTSDDVSEYQRPVTAVAGQNSVALGNRAVVGRTENYVDDNGTPEDTSDDVEHTRIVPVNRGTAIGADATVGHNNSTAIGAGAKSTDTNQVTLGTKSETISAPGITSQLSKDRQVGSLELVTSDAQGRLATDGGSVFNRLNAFGTRLDEHAKGLAISMAMPDVWLSDKKRFGIFGGVGGFEGETALGFGVIGRIDETFTLNAKGGADTDFDHFGWQVGVGAQW